MIHVLIGLALYGAVSVLATAALCIFITRGKVRLNLSAPKPTGHSGYVVEVRKEVSSTR